MEINATFMTIVGSGLWLFACCALANTVRDWADQRGRESERHRRWAQLGQ